MECGLRVLAGVWCIGLCVRLVREGGTVYPRQVSVAFVSKHQLDYSGRAGRGIVAVVIGQGVQIHFAHRTFRWSNDARGKAAVFCVIIGFGLQDVKMKRLYDNILLDAEPVELSAGNISPYLVDAFDVLIASRRSRFAPFPK